MKSLNRWTWTREGITITAFLYGAAEIVTLFLGAFGTIALITGLQ